MLQDFYFNLYESYLERCFRSFCLGFLFRGWGRLSILCASLGRGNMAARGLGKKKDFLNCVRLDGLGLG